MNASWYNYSQINNFDRVVKYGNTKNTKDTKNTKYVIRTTKSK